VKNVKEWSVRLQGDRQDLVNVARLSHSSTTSIREERGEFYLRSTQFASLRDANEVASLTGRLLPMLNSFRTIYSCSEQPIKAVSVIATRTNGNQVVVNFDSPIWAWGSNDSGQLGTSSIAVENIPNRIVGLPFGAGELSAGNRHALSIKQAANTFDQTFSGNVFAWGSNAHGELGIGTTSATPILVPTQVIDSADPSGFLGNVKAIAAGGNHSLALKTDGTVWSWGFNSNGQVGDGTRVDRSSPVQVLGLNDIESICAGSFHSLALRSDGSVFAWGFNEEGQLGIGFFSADSPTPIQVIGPFGNGFLNDIQALGAGLAHSLAVRRSDGAVFAWG
jgi:alpha-tubulin suppressor-like RCC1 family protein